MPKPFHRMLAIATAAFLFSGYFALAQWPQWGYAVFAIPAVLLFLSPAGRWLDARYKWYKRLTNTANALWCVALPVLIYMTSLMTAVTALAIYIQCFILMHVLTTRRRYHLVLMTYFLVMAAVSRTEGAMIGPAVLFVLVSGLWTLAALHLQSVALAGNGGRLPHLAALNTTPSGSMPSIAADAPVKLGGALVVLSALAVALSIGTFLVFPRVEAGLFGRDDDEMLITGISGSIDLNITGELRRDPRAVMRVEFPQEPARQYDGPMFWRVSALERYSAGSWDQLRMSFYSRRGMPRRFSPSSAPDRSSIWREIAARRDQRMVVQIIYLDEVPDAGLPCLPFVRDASAENVSLTWDQYGELNIHPMDRGLRTLTYRAVSNVAMPSPDELRVAGDDYNDYFPSRYYQALTRHDLPRRSIELTEEIVSAADTPYEKAQAIEDWFGKSDFAYTLAIPNPGDRHPIDYFLNDNRAGHCELFASAMALMLRSQDIPARVVTGFRGGVWDAADSYYTVHADMAHLWVEVFFPGYGWVTFDPSPLEFGIAYGRSGQWRRILSKYLLNVKMAWFRYVIGYNPGDFVEQLRETWERFWRHSAFGPEGEEDGGPPAIPPGVAPMVLIFMLLLLPWLRERRRRRLARAPSASLTEAQTRAAQVYLRLRRRLTQWGVPCEGKTASEIAEAVKCDPLLDPAPATEIIDAYNAVRFGGRPLTHQEYRALTRRLRAVQPRK